MSDFETILNREIVEAGRVPDARVIDRTKELVEILEDYTSDIRVLTPIVSSHSDCIVFNSVEEEKGFSLYIYLDRRNGDVLEEELTAWNKTNPVSVSLKGSLKNWDFDYVFKHVISLD